MSRIEQRKDDHISLSLDDGSQGRSSFESLRLPYDALPELSLDDVSTSTELLGARLSQPLIIASMTGGSEHGRTINTNLAIAAEECGVAMGVGSQRIGLENPDARDTFELVRKHAPTAFVAANIGAAQLNLGHGVDSVRAIVDMVAADAVYVHLNPLQEAIQPEGDTDFGGLAAKIAAVVEGAGVPVLVKEVGHGLSGDVARRLFEVGVAGVDVAGVGGTSYAWIEARRAGSRELEDWFARFGLTTVEALDEVAGLVGDPGDDADRVMIASGGLRSPLDGLKARAIGATHYSAARPFLEVAMASPEATVDRVRTWQRGLQVGLFACGVASWTAAWGLRVRRVQAR